VGVGGTVKIPPTLILFEAAIVESVGVLEEAFPEITAQRSAAQQS
jgi:hypothetical protein